jgi:DNA-binding response OmpR family regulator
MSRVLIVEDEHHIADGIRFNLEAEGLEADVVGDGTTALSRLLAERDRFDAVILDVMLPGRDGFEVASALRAGGQFVPILMLTARGRPEDVMKGFEAGADDYLPKPFDLGVLLARVRGLLRRQQWQQQPPQQTDSFAFNGRTLDFGAMEVRAHGAAHPLTRMECDLLRYFVRNAGKPIARKTILEEVWGLHEDTDTRAIDNFIVRLRRYLEDDPARPRYLLTVRGVGYKFVPGATSSSPTSSDRS